MAPSGEQLRWSAYLPACALHLLIHLRVLPTDFISSLHAGRSQLRLQRRGCSLRSAPRRGRGKKKAGVLSRRQLDAQLDDYMSTTKSRLDKDLDDYMSLSKSRLDAELDEYMSLAGQSDVRWQ